MLKKFFIQFSNPKGLLGYIVGKIMAKTNQKLNKWTISLLDIKQNDRIFEIGFGPGYAIALATKEATNGFIAGIDFSEVMLKQAKARNRVGVNTGKVDLRLADVEELPTFTTKFDKVFAVNSSIFWREPVSSLNNIREVMNYNGVIALTVQMRYRGATNENVKEWVEQMESGLIEAGFIEIHTKVMRSVDGVCVLAKKPLS